MQLNSVTRQLSEADRQLMEEEGISLPRKWERRRKRRKGRSGEGGAEGSSKDEAGKDNEVMEREKKDEEWDEVRKFMDPNPQLSGVDPGRYAPKVK